MDNRTRDTAAAHETEDIALLIEAIHAKTPTGQKICDAFSSVFPTAKILDARGRDGTSRKTHYDFEILVRKNMTTPSGHPVIADVWETVEHKGGQNYTPFKAGEVPWSVGVQFHNGGCEMYSLAKKYAEKWYELYIASDALRREFQLTAPTPTFEEWWAKDCKTQADPRSAFGKELKEKVRSARGPKTSLLEKREAVLSALTITPEDESTLKQEVAAVANEVLRQKTYWLSIRGNLRGDFYVQWHPQFVISTIQKVEITKEKDMLFVFHCDNDVKIRGILRWGKGAGFSCLRLDLK